MPRILQSMAVAVHVVEQKCYVLYCTVCTCRIESFFLFCKNLSYPFCFVLHTKKIRSALEVEKKRKSKSGMVRWLHVFIMTIMTSTG